MGWLSNLFGAGRSAPRLPLIEWREGSYPTSAVGESYYQEAFIAICGRPTRSGYEIACEAHLIPERNNPHDANAVKVMINGRNVGHLCRDDAVRFREEMATAGRPGHGARCAAKIAGGWRTNQYDEGLFGVRLGVPGRGRFTLV